MFKFKRKFKKEMEKMERQIKKEHKRIEKDKEEFFKRHEKRTHEVDEAFKSLYEILNSVKEETESNNTKVETIETENSKKLDDISRELDALLASM